MIITCRCMTLYAISSVCLAVQLAILCGKNFCAGHCWQSIQQNSFKPALDTGAVVYHFERLSVALFLAEGHKVSGMRNLLALFHAHFSTDHPYFPSTA